MAPQMGISPRSPRYTLAFIFPFTSWPTFALAAGTSDLTSAPGQKERQPLVLRCRTLWFQGLFAFCLSTPVLPEAHLSQALALAHLSGRQHLCSVVTSERINFRTTASRSFVRSAVPNSAVVFASQFVCVCSRLSGPGRGRNVENIINMTTRIADGRL